MVLESVTQEKKKLRSVVGFFRTRVIDGLH